MQVNSAQDYLTLRKRQLVAATFYSTPPPQEGKTNGVWINTVANSATTRQRFILPTPSAWGSAPGGPVRFSNFCVGCFRPTGAPGTFAIVNRKDILSRQALRPLGVQTSA